MYAILVGLKLWGWSFKGKRFQIACDNAACVDLLNRGRAKQPVMQRILREIVYLSAMGNYWIRVVHIIRSLNKILDQLSRWNTSKQVRSQFREYNRDRKLEREWTSTQMFELTNDW